MQGWERRADAATANRLVGLQLDAESFAGFAGKKRAPFLSPAFHKHPRKSTQLYPGAVMPLFRIIRLKFGGRFVCLWAISMSAVWTSHAQLDPEPRQLLHVGVSQSLHNDGPQARYLKIFINVHRF